jgi:hypothetical protein
MLREPGTPLPETERAARDWYESTDNDDPVVLARAIDGRLRVPHPLYLT